MKKILSSLLLLALSATFSVAGVIRITKQTYIDSASISPDDTITIGIEANAQNIRYQWQYRVDENTPWANIRGADTAYSNELKVNVTAESSGYQFRCKVASDSTVVYSKSVIIVIKSDLQIVRDLDSDLVIPSNANTKMKIIAIGHGTKTVSLEGRIVECDPLGYQWQIAKLKKVIDKKRNDKSPSDTDFVNILGQTTNIVDLSQAKLDTTGNYNNFIRCVVTDGENKKLTKSTKITKLELSTINVKVQPQSQTIYYNATTELSILVSNPRKVVDSKYVLQLFGEKGWEDSTTISDSTTGSFPIVWKSFPPAPLLARILMKYEANVGVFDDNGNIVIDPKTGQQKITTELKSLYSSEFYLDAIPTLEITSHSNSDIVMTEGDSQTMSVVARSLTRNKLNYKWQKTEAKGKDEPVVDGDWADFKPEENVVTNLNKLIIKSIPYPGKDKVYHYRCRVSDTMSWSNNDYIEDAVFTITVIERKPTFTKQPKSEDGFFEGKSAKLSVETSGSNVEYKWQYYDAENIKWIDYASTTDTLTIDNVVAADIGKKIRCIATNAGGTTVSSNYVVTFNETVSIKRNPVDAEVIAGRSAKFTVSAAGSSPSYQWQIKDSSSWTDIDGATSQTLTLSGISNDIDGTQYRCVVSNRGSSVISAAAKLIVNQPTIVTTPSTSVYVFENEKKSISVNVNAEPSFNYEWFAKIPPSKDWSRVASGKISSQSKAEISYGVYGSTIVKGTRYYCSVWSDNSKYPNKVKSKEISVFQSAPTSVERDSAKTKTGVFDGAELSVKTSDASATFALKVKAVGSINYQWLISTDNGSTWSPIVKANRNSYTTPRLSSQNTPDDFSSKYRCTVTTSAGDTFSEVFSVVKLDAIDASQINPIADVNVDSKSVAEFRVTTTYPDKSALKYIWQVSKDNGETWSNVGSTKDTFSIKGPNVRLSGYLYRCLVGNAGNGSNFVPSNAAKLSVKEAARFVSQPKAVTTFQGENARFEVNVTGYNLVYIWEISHDNGKTWSTIKSASSDNFVDYSSDSIVKSDFVRCRVVSKDDNGVKIGSEIKSSNAKLSVNAQSSISNVSFEQSDIKKDNADNIGAIAAYFGFPAKLQVSAAGYGIKYQWFKKNAQNWDLLGTSATLNLDTRKPAKASELPIVSIYKCRVFNGTASNGTEVWTKEITISMSDPIAPTSIAGQSASLRMSMPSVNATYDLVFAGSSDLRIVKSDDNSSFTSSSYTFKRKTPTKAEFTLKYTLSSYETGKNIPTKISYSYKGELTFTTTNLPSGTLVDTKTKENGTIELLSLTNGSKAPVNMKEFEYESINIKASSIALEHDIKLTDSKSFVVWKSTNPAWKEIKGTYTYTKVSNIGLISLLTKVDKMSVKIDYAFSFITDNSGTFIAREIYNGKDSKGNVAALNNRAYSGTFTIDDSQSMTMVVSDEEKTSSTSSGSLMLNSSHNTKGMDFDYISNDMSLTVSDDVLALGGSGDSFGTLEFALNNSCEVVCNGVSVGGSTIDCSSIGSITLTCSATFDANTYIWLISDNGSDFVLADNGRNSPTFVLNPSSFGGKSKFVKCMVNDGSNLYYTSDVVKLVP